MAKQTNKILTKNDFNNTDEYIKYLENTAMAFKKIVDELVKRNNELELMQANYQKNKFGSTKETLYKNIAPGQLSFFDTEELPKEVQEVIEQEKKEKTVSSKAAQKKTKTGLTRKAMKNAQTENVVYEEESDICDICGGILKEITKTQSYSELVFIPARFIMRNHISKVLKCSCCGNKNDNPANIVKTQTKKPIFNANSMASASLLADVIVQKFFQGVPLYRQEKIWEDRGLILRRNTLANWLILGNKYYFSLLHLLMMNDIKKCNLIHADETTIQCNKEDGKPANSNSYMWVLASGENEDKDIVVFKYYDNRSEEAAKDLLKDYHKNLITDGYAAYNNLEIDNHGGCWAHARRKFYDAIPKTKKIQDTESNEYNMVVLIDKLFKLDSHIKTCETKEEKLKYRRENVKPVFDLIYQVAEKYSMELTNSKKMVDALGYLFNQKEKLSVFLNNSNFPIDNNRAERTIRPFAIGRKNWLFADSVDGADTLAVIQSLVQTAKLNNLNLHSYFEYILDEMAQMTNSTSIEEFRKFLPYSKKLPSHIYNLDDEDLESSSEDNFESSIEDIK